MEFTDRYQALGMPYPNVETMCQGHCEGTGWYPENDQNDPLWQKAHAEAGRHECDGYHFVKCPMCNGTGRRDAALDKE